MNNLAIRGHATRGKEVIEILEMLGGKNKQEVGAIRKTCVYFIDNGIISFLKINQLIPEQFIVFALEEFEEKFPYKVGDKVKIAETGKIVSIEYMSWRNESCEVAYETCYNNDCVAYYSTIELQPYKEETMKSKPNLLQQLKDYFDNTPREVIEKEWREYDKYNEIGPTVNEYLEYVNRSRQPQYPKTYEECCEVLNYIPNSYDADEILVYGYMCDELRILQKLLVCRDAYWKIAGEEMGLDKPWEPDFKDDSDKYFICYLKDEIWKSNIRDCNRFLVFPTEKNKR